MRIANVEGRLCLLTDDGAVDVHEASDGRFDADPQAVYGRWDEFLEWTSAATPAAARPFREDQLGAPVPRPTQVLAIGLNYHDHAAESGLAAPTSAPPVFTKYPSCITGPFGDVTVPPEGHTDWEVELVVVIGRRAFAVAEADAWRVVAGLTVGQDLSERILQLASTPPQFSLGKSLPGFGPIGPCLVTVDEFDNPDDVELTCSVNGQEVQKGHTRDLIFGVPALIAYLSRVMPLLPGDIIFTGTPAGVGMGRNPQVFLKPGDELVTSIERIGEMRHRMV
jgi:2-keto-4-pentenoate hydratase/2-oxohepta-3-ene-1,7-dioic acid hydratase in catechol pathway